ncbi:hypothetical protein [Pelotomaculum sp. FP]|uniref:hypothetical protein n=1 Tax=Pelotomaculum sp. FP TaxID=261474 RepID=UPI001291251E|nr:hypothetical protein [Pelotomaculum sp. FP]
MYVKFLPPVAGAGGDDQGENHYQAVYPTHLFFLLPDFKRLSSPFWFMTALSSYHLWPAPEAMTRERTTTRLYIQRICFSSFQILKDYLHHFGL